MKKLQVLAVVATLIGSAALTEAATQLNLRVEGDAGAGWAEDIDVEAGQSVDYRVLGVLSNNDQNEGLALFGFDVSYSCGDLTTQMAVSTGDCMDNFEIPLGINNPAGFGGTTNVPEHLGDLVQVGGAVNTILNDAGNAPYPTGAVCLGLGWTEVVLATGSLTIPGDAQDQDQCTIDLSAVFANVIALGEVSDGTFFSVEPADPGAATSLTMTVSTQCAAFFLSDPDCDKTLPRTQNNIIRIEFAGGSIAAPLPGEIEIRELPSGSDLFASSFTATVDGNVLTLVENGDILANETWYTVENTGAWGSVCGTFKRDYVVVYGDADGNGETDVIDAAAIMGERADPAPADKWRFDIDGNGAIDVIDAASGALGNRGATAPPKPDGEFCNP